MEIRIQGLNSKELVELYHKTNAEIRKRLIDGTSWDELKDSITLITELSKEISKRNISFNDSDNAPADTALR